MQLEVMTTEPDSQARATPLLFVHGMWHGAWCWAEYLMPYLAEHGYASYVLSLRGHAGSEGHEGLRWHSLADYVADVDQVASQLPAAPVLVGHSMGGMIVQKYLESRQVPAGVLLAAAPPGGLIPSTLRFALRHPLAFLKALLTLRCIRSWVRWTWRARRSFRRTCRTIRWHGTSRGCKTSRFAPIWP